ncbi:vanadium-dependent haloperoxidase [Natronolimnobius baerhuensis]|uniref:vanadium-dependent haloperoxidase n=1 Tax=Natronolimnobius baerhuensis TaxID=253108 RepID=UPI001124D6B9|nr:vanadium-dependent haloperoxidase [Natronolimnobius baerhuensis]
MADTRIRSSHSSQAPPSTARRRQFLALGASAVAGSLAGCLSLRGPAADPATDPVCRWNEQFIEEIQHFRGGNFAPTRRGALLNVAMFDAVNGVVAAADEDHFEPYFADPTDAPADAPPLAALAGAADEVMTTLYGSEFDETLEATLVAADGGDAGAGEAWGRRVATDLLAHRDDEYTTGIYVPCEEATQAGCFRRDWNPVYATVRPWTLESHEQFRPDGPPALESEAYAADWHEVYEQGRAGGDRPQEHVDIAAFWRGAPGSPRPPNMWNVITQTLMLEDPLPVLEEVRLFALLSLALADAGIAGSDGKAEYGFWRPRTAIHHADRDGNSDTHADQSWEPRATGGSPEYPSTLAAYGGAGCAVLEGVLGRGDYAFEFGGDIRTGTTGEDEGITRSFDSLEDALEESLDSRIYVGNHFRFTMDDSCEMGEQIGEWVLENYLRPV